MKGKQKAANSSENHKPKLNLPPRGSIDTRTLFDQILADTGVMRSGGSVFFRGPKWEYQRLCKAAESLPAGDDRDHCIKTVEEFGEADVGSKLWKERAEEFRKYVKGLPEIPQRTSLLDAATQFERGLRKRVGSPVTFEIMLSELRRLVEVALRLPGDDPGLLKLKNRVTKLEELFWAEVVDVSLLQEQAEWWRKRAEAYPTGSRMRDFAEETASRMQMESERGDYIEGVSEAAWPNACRQLKDRKLLWFVIKEGRSEWEHLSDGYDDYVCVDEDAGVFRRMGPAKDLVRGSRFLRTSVNIGGVESGASAKKLEAFAHTLQAKCEAARVQVDLDSVSPAFGPEQEEQKNTNDLREAVLREVQRDFSDINKLFDEAALDAAAKRVGAPPLDWGPALQDAVCLAMSKKFGSVEDLKNWVVDNNPLERGSKNRFEAFMSGERASDDVDQLGNHVRYQNLKQAILQAVASKGREQK